MGISSITTFTTFVRRNRIPAIHSWKTLQPLPKFQWKFTDWTWACTVNIQNMVIDHVLVSSMSSTWKLVLMSCPPLQATFLIQPTLSAPSERIVFTVTKIESGCASQGNEKMDRSKNTNFRGNISVTHVYNQCGKLLGPHLRNMSWEKRPYPHVLHMYIEIPCSISLRKDSQETRHCRTKAQYRFAFFNLQYGNPTKEIKPHVHWAENVAAKLE